MSKRSVELGGILIILLVLFMFGPSGHRLAELTAATLQRRAAVMHEQIAQARNFVWISLPRVASQLSNVLTGLAVLMAGFGVYLLVVVPVQIHLLHRKVDHVEAELALLRHDVERATSLLAVLSDNPATDPGIEQGAFVAKTPSPQISSERHPPLQA